MNLLAPTFTTTCLRFCGRIAVAGILCSFVTTPVTARAAEAPPVRGPAPRADQLMARRVRRGESLPVPILDAAEVHAGETIVLHWRSLEGVAEELELVFSLDDGRTFDVRVSPELSGGECRYTWRVPNVGVQRAHMRLRARVNGEELSGPASAEFSMVPNPVGAPGLWVYRHGEWWEDRGGVPFDLPGLISPPRLPSLRSDTVSLTSALIVRTPAPGPHTGPSTPAHAVTAPAQERPAPPSENLPTFHPMRE